MIGSEDLASVAGVTNDIAIAGGQILGDEYSEHVLKVSCTPQVTSLTFQTNCVSDAQWSNSSRRVCT